MADHERLFLLWRPRSCPRTSSNNAVPLDQLPSLIQQVFNTLATVEQKTVELPRREPAVPIKQSVRPGPRRLPGAWKAFLHDQAAS